MRRSFAISLLFTTASMGGLSGRSLMAAPPVHAAVKEDVSPQSAQDLEVRLETYLQAVAPELGPEQREAFARIEGAARRLLALRGYLRAGPDVGTRWAWSKSKIEDYEKSAEHALAMAEIDKVNTTFSKLNPGCSLRVNTKVRSLDEQIDKWNESESVGRIGEQLLTLAQTELASESYATVDSAAVKRFARFLRESPRERVALAVPGYSLHGQCRAFDFQVMCGGKLVAGTSFGDAPKVWDESGWTAKLEDAVRQCSTQFKGPLELPREPWHYEYLP